MSIKSMRLINLSKVLFLIFLILFCVSALDSVSADEVGNSSTGINNSLNDTNISTTATGVSSNSIGSSMSSVNAFSTNENAVGVGSNTTKWSEELNISGSPVVSSDGKTIYVCGYNGSLYAFNNNGSISWRFETSTKLLNSPIIGKSGTIYVINEANNLYAINPNGTLKWKYSIGVVDDKNSGSSPVCDDDENIYFTTKNGVLGSVTINGIYRWSIQVHGTVDQMSGFNILTTPYILGAPVVSNGRLYITDLHDLDAGNFYETGIVLICVNTSNGNILWENSFDQNGASIQYNSIAVANDGTVLLTTSRNWHEGLTYGRMFNGYIDGPFPYNVSWEYFYINNTNLYAFSPDGTLLWKWGDNSTGLKVYGSPYITSNGAIYIVYDDYLVALYNGTILWKYKHNGVSSSYVSPIVDGLGTIYLSTTSGLLAINPDGSLKWRKNTGPIKCSIVIGTDGTIYFADDKYLYALNNITADFSYNIVSNLDVKFTDKSDGNGLYYLWDFGDGYYSSEKNPIHTYLTNGNYIVTLTIGTGNYFNVYTKIINVTDRTAPYINVSHPSGSYNQKIIINITLNENGFVYYTIDGSNPVIGRNLLNSSLSISKNTILRLIAVDIYENPSAIYTFNYVIGNPNNSSNNNISTNNNNVKSITPKPIILSDLKIISTKTKGTNIYIKIKNIGTSSSSKSKLLIYYNKKYYKIVNVPKIAKGKSKIIKVDFYKNLAKKTKTAEINYKRKSKESDYYNNKVKFKNSIIKDSKVDLVITSTKTKGSYCYITVKNIGKESSSKSSLVVYHNKKNNIVDVPKIGKGKTKVIKVKFFKNLMKKDKIAHINFNKKSRESDYNNNVVKFKNSITHNSYNLMSDMDLKSIKNNVVNINTIVNGSDLVVTSIVRVYLADKYPNDPKYYNSTIYNVTIKNQGTKSIDKSQLKIALSNEHYTLADIPALKGGQSVSILVFSINEDYRNKHDDWGIGYTNQETGERLTKYVTINYNKKVSEVNYNNNYLTFKDDYYRYLPDLKVVDIKRSENIYSVTISNLGSATAKASKLMIWYDNSHVMEINVPAISIGQSVVIKINFFSYPSHSSVYKYILLNYAKTVLETDYTNNAIKFKM